MLFSTSVSLTLRFPATGEGVGTAMVSRVPVVTIMARSTTLRSSRMLPGHEYACSAAMFSGDGLDAFAERIRDASTKRHTRTGMSSMRSRSGGTWMGKTLSL